MGRRSFDRTDIEAAINHENWVLERCLDLLNERKSLSDWDDEVAEALLGAIADDGVRNEPEAEKARKLRHHLFENEAGPTARPDKAHVTTAERIRADLAGLVPAGAGLHLTH
ncbi:hypothetical protein N825_15555 [Skermanella stibiiresistens SB22]|uniref:Uncharacterized protein n=2 Tax=Skermanella TaxID=204447 RepID=W9H2U8_9PROT|nr:hypothetical protein N825_15555 [Skermanella stibiiresistens SB22]